MESEDPNDNVLSDVHPESANTEISDVHPESANTEIVSLLENQALEESDDVVETENPPESVELEAPEETINENETSAAVPEVTEPEPEDPTTFSLDTLTLRSSRETINVEDKVATEEDKVATEEDPKETDKVEEEETEAVVEEDQMTIQTENLEEILQSSDKGSVAESGFVLLDEETKEQDAVSLQPSATYSVSKDKKRKKSVKSSQSKLSSIGPVVGNKIFASTKEGTVQGEEEEESLEEEEDEEDEEQMTEYARYQYYQMYDELYKQYVEEMTKNSFFIKKLVVHYQKRKMFHVLCESKVGTDVQKKYEKQLEDYESVTQLQAKEQKEIDEQVEDLKEQCVSKEHEAQRCFDTLQNHEKEVGKEIINSESGKNYGEKFIDRYLKRQKIQLSNLKKIRLDYIKIRNKVAETQEALDAIDNLGPDLHLIDYEQLKLDNRNLLDKLEEKESELTKVRTRCQNVSQILAHRREKSDAMHADLTFLNETLTTVTGDYDDVREELNSQKMGRDYYRSEIEKMKKEAGLLSKPKLLRDMSDTVHEGDYLSQKLEDIRQEYGALAAKVKNIRRNKRSKARLKAIREKMLRGDNPKNTNDDGSQLLFKDFEFKFVEKEKKPRPSLTRYKL